MSKRCVGLAILTSQILFIAGAADRDIGPKCAGRRPTDPFVAARRASATCAWVGRFRELLDERIGDLLVEHGERLAQTRRLFVVRRHREVRRVKRAQMIELAGVFDQGLEPTA